METSRRLATEAAERARRKQEELALAERKAKKGQETANIKLGVEEESTSEVAAAVDKTTNRVQNTLSSSLALGGTGKPRKKTGVQL